MTISDWLISNNAPLSSLAAFRGQFNVQLSDVGAATLTCVAGVCVATSSMMELSASGSAPCFVRLTTSTRKRQVVSQLYAATSLLPFVASLSGDPHISGPRGERFDFDGEAVRCFSFEVWLYVNDIILYNSLLS